MSAEQHCNESPSDSKVLVIVTHHGVQYIFEGHDRAEVDVQIAEFTAEQSKSFPTYHPEMRFYSAKLLELIVEVSPNLEEFGPPSDFVLNTSCVPKR
jgi:hypothetical protein